MAIVFEKATKRRARARIALDGPAGSGKTMTALRVARGLGGPDGRIAVIDTERGSASLYADKIAGGYDTVELQSFSPDKYVEAINAAVEAGYAVIVIDSLSHAWEGKDGALEMKDRAERRTGNGWTAWREVTPAHNRLVEAMLQCPVHLIATMRSKMEYVQEKDEKTGKTVIRKIGLAPIQRPGLEYEFTLVGDLNVEHALLVSKTRCEAFDNASILKPGEEFGAALLKWLNEGAPEKPAHPAPSAAQPASAPSAPASQNPPSAPTPEPGGAVAAVAAPAALPAQTFASFAERLRGANSQIELDGAASEIAFAVQNGRVTATERGELIKVYIARQEQLTAAKAA